MPPRPQGRLPNPITTHPGDPRQPPMLTVQLRAPFVPDTDEKRAAYVAGDLAGLARQVGARGLWAALQPHASATRPLLEVDPASLLEQEAAARHSPYAPETSLTQYWRIDLRHDPEAIVPLLARLRALKAVELAWQLPLLTGPISPLMEPEFGMQTWMHKAPKGVGAKAAWTRSVLGAGTRFVDVECAWHPASHVELPATLLSGGVIKPAWGSNAADSTLLSCGGKYLETGAHGIRALGIVLAQTNSLRVAGLAPETTPAGVVSYIPSTSHEPIDVDLAYTNLPRAIYEAERLAGHGGVVLLEVQWLVPTGCMALPVELLPDVRTMIRYTVARGCAVIEPAGNSNMNLDLYPELRRGFPGFIDSGAILVAASIWNGGLGKNVKRSDSNHGRRIDCFASGEAHTLTNDTGYPAGPWHDTGTFTGTSSASAIIAGVALLVQSHALVATGARLTPADLRDRLSEPTTGTAGWHYTGAFTDGSMGIMPDLAEILPLI